jgi:hypothetical protein
LGKFDNPESLAKQARCQAKLVGVLTEYAPKNKAMIATGMPASVCYREKVKNTGAI